ncbi:helix-turn-helix domain-containing protein [Ralstonia insidiosa]|uniref:Helix-turn-helix transcriptional regulator n=1 Tax=Ralstonia insidiosa TaxID=190721 RepID=A0A848P0K1_9RALS|nr:helix-turn-helix domain-containing protein [Ralstonia insidiosa]NMV37218.1 helix-turn-helix transcriptional regulator [Ralstonia insidiosa]
MSIAMGKRVRERRDLLKMSQRELADRIGCSQPMIKKIEAGSKTALGLKLAEALGTTLEYLERGHESTVSSRAPEELRREAARSAEEVQARLREMIGHMNPAQLAATEKMFEVILGRYKASPTIEGIAQDVQRKSGSTVQLSDVFNPHTPMGTDTQAGERDERKGRTHKRS